MYTIHCGRCGTFSRSNNKAKGIFKKSFRTLSELAMFIYKSNNKLFFPMINKELTMKEDILLMKKINALRRADIA